MDCWSNSGAELRFQNIVRPSSPSLSFSNHHQPRPSRQSHPRKYRKWLELRYVLPHTSYLFPNIMHPTWHPWKFSNFTAAIEGDGDEHLFQNTPPGCFLGAPRSSYRSHIHLPYSFCSSAMPLRRRRLRRHPTAISKILILPFFSKQLASLPEVILASCCHPGPPPLSRRIVRRRQRRLPSATFGDRRRSYHVTIGGGFLFGHLLSFVDVNY